MTTEAPDPRTFKSWEDAFQYPIPIVRKLEQQLRSNVNENREKLRSLVGASYRGLLGTAERIVEMNDTMQQIEMTLGTVGQKCNSRAVEKISKNYARLDEQLRAQDKDHYAFASQLAVLRSCPTVISRLLRGGGSLLLAAKILVISRLLHKTLSGSSDLPPFVEKLRNQLASLRRRLLSHVDKRFSNPDADVPDLMETMCAFSLATSSTPTDVLKHFHHVRLEAIKDYFEKRQDIHSKILQALKLYVRTLHDTQAVFPKRLAELLGKLRTQPLLKDKDVQGVMELNLDVHERWIADEVRNFTPWPRHDELQKAEADRLLKSWANQALSSYMSGIKSVLSDEKDLQAVVQLRKDMFETWLSSSSRLNVLDPAAVLDDLRDLMTSHLSSLITDRAQGLQTVSDEISQVLESWQPGISGATMSLWDTSITSMELSNGAAAFKHAILDRSQGCNDTLTRVLSACDSWTQSISDIHRVIKGMKDTRWDADLMDDADDEFGLDSQQALLSEDDPRSLEETLDKALSNAITNLQRQTGELTSHYIDSSSAHQFPKSIFLLRVLRSISHRLPQLGTKATTSPTVPASLIQPLHNHLASAVSAPALATYSKTLTKLARSTRTPAQSLWEGSPPLPVQPSAGTFKFLRVLVGGMADAGADVWAPGAVRVLKTAVQDEVAARIGECCTALADEKKNDGSEQTRSQGAEGVAEGAIDGEELKSGGSEGRAIAQGGKLTQLLFDVMYLQRALAVPSSAGGGEVTEKRPLDTVAAQVGDGAALDDAALERLRKGAAEYWKRTYLLFALLA